jgi:hypothetical protein
MEVNMKFASALFSLLGFVLSAIVTVWLVGVSRLGSWMNLAPTRRMFSFS